MPHHAIPPLQGRSAALLEDAIEGANASASWPPPPSPPPAPAPAAHVLLQDTPVHSVRRTLCGCPPSAAFRSQLIQTSPAETRTPPGAHPVKRFPRRSSTPSCPAARPPRLQAALSCNDERVCPQQAAGVAWTPVCRPRGSSRLGWCCRASRRTAVGWADSAADVARGCRCEHASAGPQMCAVCCTARRPAAKIRKFSCSSVSAAAAAPRGLTSHFPMAAHCLRLVFLHRRARWARAARVRPGSAGG